MLLDVAVEQRQPRLIGGEVHAGASVDRHHDRVLDDARGRLAVDLGDLEQVPMQVQRMRIVGAVAKDEPVARALLEHELLIVRIRLAVDREAVELARAARHLFEHHVDGLQRGSRRGLDARLAEDGVVPRRFCRRDPLRLPPLVRVFDDDAQAAVADVVFGRAQDPDARLVHLHVRIDAFARAR